MAKRSQKEDDLKRYPQLAKYLITACDRAIKTRLAQGKDSKYKSGEEMFFNWLFETQKFIDNEQNLFEVEN